MTLTEVRQDLFNFFTTHDSFSIDENFDDLYVLTSKEEKPLKVALIEKALEEFEQKIVVKILRNVDQIIKKEVWVLDKPLEKYTQTIELSSPTIIALSKFVNSYCDQTKDKSGRVNPLNITDADIQSALIIANSILLNQNV